MDALMRAIEAGRYRKAFDLLQVAPEARTLSGVASGAFLLALTERFDEAEQLLSTTALPDVAVIVRGERERLARWRDPRAAAQLSSAVSLPFLDSYAGMALAFAQRDEERADQLCDDLAGRVPPISGRLHLTSGTVQAFTNLADSDDAIGQMLETYCGSGLLYFPLAALRRVEFLPKTNFMDALMPKVQITDIQGQTMHAFVPLLYPGSSMATDELTRTGRQTSFEYLGRARRGHGQRDLVVDGGTMLGLQDIAAIELDA